MTEIKFDFETQSATPVRSGGLTTLTETQSGLTMTIRRGSSAFDIVANTGAQQKPAAFGNRSLDPFVQPDNPTPFLINFSSLVYSVSVTMGDADPDTDVLWLKAYARENAEGRLIATYTDTLTADSAGAFTSKVLTITSDIPFRSIELLGGSPPARNSVYYDNIIVNTEAPATPPNDNTPVNARNLGTLTGNYTIQDFVDASDPADYYKFTFDYVTDFNANLAGISGRVNQYLYRDFNGNGLIDANEEIGRREFNQTSNLPQILTPGTYFLLISQYDVTRYDLAITTTAHPTYTPAIDPGSTASTALNLGTLTNETFTLKDYAGNLDGFDYYQFKLNSVADFNANLAGISGRVNQYLYRDFNGNGLIDANEEIGRREFNQTSNLPQILTPGTYFLLVSQYDVTRYDLTITTTLYPTYTPTADPGNRDREALDLGVLSGMSTIRDYVGNLDGVDYYKFSVNQGSNFQANLAGLSGRVNLYLYRDNNGNGLIDGGEEIARREFNQNNSLAQALTPGNYFLLIAQYDATRYDLTLLLT